MDHNAGHGWLEAGKAAIETAALAGQLASPMVGPIPAQADLNAVPNQAHEQIVDYEQQGMDWLGLQAEREIENLSHFDPGAGGPPA